MKIAGIYSFNDGKKFVSNNFKKKIKELKNAITAINANLYKTKESKEKTMPGKILCSPVGFNSAFKDCLLPLGWKNVKEQCQYSNKFYVDGYKSPMKKKVYPYRDMDFVKNSLGVEVQFGKYSFMVYNVCAKMTIFKNLGHIIAGVEIVPVKELAEQMSTGVSYFEQFVWDLEQRGTANIDIPVMIIGISA